MSTVKTVKYQVGTDGTSTNNFTIYQPDPPDGTMRVGNGNADAPTDVAQVNGDGFKFTSNIQIGTDATSSNNFTIYQPATPDGTLRIGVGNADSPTEVGQFNSNGIVPKQSIISVVFPSTNTSASNATFTKVLLDTITVDNDSSFDTTNNRFNPQIAGYYKIDAQVGFISASGGMLSEIYKNGSAANFRGNQQYNTTANRRNLPVTGVIYMNGSTDYLELYGFHGTGSTQSIAGTNSAHTRFSAYLIHQA